jgi:replicative superfamily II helicase
MVDFNKRLKKQRIEKKTNPIELYNSLDRRSVAGPLRPAQHKILEDWYLSRKDDRDLIIKLHTGEGKTLIGLLILQSKLNDGKGPSLFVCPNKYLVQQVRKDAKKFGINYCVIGDDNELPNDFIDGNKILITHVQKVFNGKTIFGLGNNYVPVGTIIIDDSHACIDSIRQTFTISVDREHDVYKELFRLFEESLQEQGHGTFLDIKNGAFDSFLPIPYWDWIEKSQEILEITSKHRDEPQIAFAWEFVKDNVTNCQAFISGHNIEISPIHVPIDKFSSFSKANHRILMSATTQDDSFFIKGLGFGSDAVKNPLNNPSQIWSGEKMLVIPSLIEESLDRIKIVNILSKPVDKNYGVVALVSSFSKAETYEKLGSIVPKSNQISGVVDYLKMGNFKHTVVLANRYDGVDLPDETCRILILDGRPYFNSLADKYEESARIDSDLINIKIAQKIEQGLGRSVRGEKDYCLILIIGGDLIRFIKSSRTNKYFSSQTKKQIEIGMEIAELASEEIDDDQESFEVVKSLMKQSLQRDEGWKEYYKEEMDKIVQEDLPSKIHNVLALERKASEQNYVGNFEGACEIVQEIIDHHCEEKSEVGWYLQVKARYMYLQSKVDSNTLQKSAFLRNNELLKPNEGITYTKLNFINENRIRRILDWIRKHKDFQELMLSVDGVLSDLQFGTASEKFESALKEAGLMIGFLSERPDKEFKKGPDNLWCGVSNQYFIFECKTEIKADRKEISKSEAGQMNTHCGWFQNQYNDSPVKRILVIPTKTLSHQADFTHNVEIMRKGKLKTLRSNIKAFFKEFNKFEIDSLSDETIQQFLNTHSLDIESLKNHYTESYRKG